MIIMMMMTITIPNDENSITRMMLTHTLTFRPGFICSASHNPGGIDDDFGIKHLGGTHEEEPCLWRWLGRSKTMDPNASQNYTKTNHFWGGRCGSISPGLLVNRHDPCIVANASPSWLLRFSCSLVTFQLNCSSTGYTPTQVTRDTNTYFNPNKDTYKGTSI